VKVARRISLALVSALVLVAVAAPASPAATVGPAVKVTDFSPARGLITSAGRYHATAVNPTTGMQIALYYAVDASSQEYIGTQLFDDEGPVGPENVVATTGLDNYYSYAIAYNPTTGGWMAGLFNNTDSSASMLAQKLSADGSASGSPVVVGDGQPGYAGIKVVWNSKAKKFLFSWSSYYEANMEGRFVSGSGTPLGSELTLMTFDDQDEYCAMDSAYSTKSNTFLQLQGGACTDFFDNTEPPVTQLVSGAAAAPIGSVNLLGPLEADSDNYTGGVAYNAKANQFGVFWNYEPDMGPERLYLQLIDAATGAEVGSPIEITPPEGLVTGTLRVRVSSSPVSGNYYVSGSFDVGTSSLPAGRYSFQVTSAGATVADSLEDVTNGTESSLRPQNLYNPKTCEFVTTFVASAVGGESYNIYANGSGPSPNCPQGKGKPTLKKKGTAGATSLKVRVGCAAAGSCRIALSGKLVGGKGKLKGKKVKAKGKSTVTLAYSDALIRELRRNGGGKIRLKAKEVGGGSRTITVTVPNPVTG
jgi:hypothetical protein